MSCEDGLQLHLQGNTVNNSTDVFLAKWNHSYTLTLLLSIIVALLSICTVLGNITVIASFARDVKLRKTRNYYILNLSICDLVVGSFTTIFALVNEIYENWQLGLPFCKLWLYVDQIVIYESVLTRLLIFWDRFLLTSKPLQYLAKQTPKRAILKILLTWTCSILIYSPLVFLNDIFPPQPPSCFTHCTIYVLRTPAFSGLKVVLAYIIPFLLMTAIGVQIYRKIHLKTLQYSQRQRVIRFRDVSAQTSNPETPSLPVHISFYKGSCSDYRRCTCPNRTFTAGVSQMAAVSVQYSTIPLEWWPWHTAHHQQIGNYRFCRVATPWPTCNLTQCTPSVPLTPTKQRWVFARGKLFVLHRKFKTLVQFLTFLIAVYFVCWTPYVISEIVNLTCDHCVTDTVIRITYWGVYYSSTINPFIYATTLKRYSLNFYLIWCWWKHDKDKQSIGSDNTTKV